MQKLSKMQICPLCCTSSPIFFESKKMSFYQCPHCEGIFRDQNQLPGNDQEKNRYLKHKNNPKDEGYQEFVRPIVEYVFNHFSPSDKGLDFGSGSNSAVSALLKENGFITAKFDPYFYNEPSALEKKYEFIVCCEVVEHFHHPRKEFQMLKKLLQAGGSLICMTNLWTEDLDFATWWYKNDSTHVFFYNQNTMQYIQNEFCFRQLSFERTLIVFSND